MGPEEIHIYFWEGAPRPPKSKFDRPKNLEIFLVNYCIFINYNFTVKLLVQHKFQL